MKTNVLVLSGGIDTSKTFESKIAQLINNELEMQKQSHVQDIVLTDVSICLGSGYGQYKKTVLLEVDGERIVLDKHTTSAPDYDYYCRADMNQSYSNFLKRIAIEVIEEYVEDVFDVIMEKRIKDLKDSEFHIRLKHLVDLGWNFIEDFVSGFEGSHKILKYPYTQHGEKEMLKEHGNDIVQIRVDGDLKTVCCIEGQEEDAPTGDDEQTLSDILELKSKGLIIKEVEI